ncbi:MAG TPA: YciI family protein [Burkholderiales bacterium]|nr:YciI family protein [Burkholderiales bacterium]
MLYAIICEDAPNSLEKRLKERPAHAARLTELKEAGRLLLAGPFPNEGTDGFSGSLIICEFNSIKEAKAWAHADPFMTSGVYKEISIKPFKQTF